MQLIQYYAVADGFSFAEKIGALSVTGDVNVDRNP